MSPFKSKSSGHRWGLAAGAAPAPGTSRGPRTCEAGGEDAFIFRSHPGCSFPARSWDLAPPARGGPGVPGTARGLGAGAAGAPRGWGGAEGTVPAARRGGLQELPWQRAPGRSSPFPSTECPGGRGRDRDRDWEGASRRHPAPGEPRGAAPAPVPVAEGGAGLSRAEPGRAEHSFVCGAAERPARFPVSQQRAAPPAPGLGPPPVLPVRLGRGWGRAAGGLPALPGVPEFKTKQSPGGLEGVRRGAG